MRWQETETFVMMEAKGAAKMKNYFYIVYDLALHKTFFFFNTEKDKVNVTSNQLKETERKDKPWNKKQNCI